MSDYFVSPLQIERFAKLFRGNTEAHYVRRPSGSPMPVYREPSFDDIRRHLSGFPPSLLSVPTNAQGNSKFAVIDVDRHGAADQSVDHTAIARKITDLRLPLIVARSTNGNGAWLMLFLKGKDGYESAAIRDVMREYARRLGVPNSEVFPKQDRILPMIHKAGTPWNLPYFGHERHAFDAQGNELDLDGFLRFAEQRAVWGVVLARDVLGTRPDGSQSRATRLSDEPTTIERARDSLTTLLYSASQAVPSTRHDLIHKAVWFAARCSLTPGLIDVEHTKNLIRKIASILFTREEAEKRGLQKELKRMWQAGLRSGPIKLALTPEEFNYIRNNFSDDEKFHRAWDGDTSDFPSAAAAKQYLFERVGERVLKASRIDDAIARELLVESQLQQLLQKLESESQQ